MGLLQEQVLSTAELPRQFQTLVLVLTHRLGVVCTLGTLSLLILWSGRLFPESVLMREPLESAFLTLLMLGVEAVYGEAKRKLKQDQVFVREHKIKINTKF